MYHCVSDYIWFASSYELWKLTNGAGNPSSVHASKSPGPRSSNDEVTTARRRTYAPELFFPIFCPIIIHRIKVPLSLSNHTCYLYRNECSLKIFHFNDLTPFVAKFRITTISRKWPFQFHISRIFYTIRLLHLASHLKERFNDFILFLVLVLSTYPCPFLCLPGIIFARKGNGSPSDAHVPCARFNRSFFVTRDANDPWQTRIRSSYRFVYETRHLWH